MARTISRRAGAPSFVAVCSIALRLVQNAAVAQRVVVPNGLDDVEGNANNSFPFDLPFAGVKSQRYQQVYAADQFAALGGPRLLTQIILREDTLAGSGAFLETIPNIRITLSTTNRSPDALSMTFAANVGPDATVVHDGPLTLIGDVSNQTPRPFGTFIDLQTPFPYDPAMGNLLMEVQNFTPMRTTSWDAVDVTGDGVSRVYTMEGGANAAVADGAFNLSLGLVTKFTFVPEPSIGTAMVSVGCAVLVRRRPARRAAR